MARVGYSFPMDQTLHIATAQPPQPCTVVVFGASGDLAKRKLIPALYNLRASDGAIGPHDFAVVGFARRAIALEQFRADARDWATRFSRVAVAPRPWDEFAAGLDYVAGLDQPDGFQRLKARLEQLEAARRLPPNRVYYLSVPPEAVRDCVERLGAAGLIAKPGAANFTRVVLEKPIGHDLESALAVNRAVHAFFDESQIFRIDHYLGKETVQNLLVLRFA
ncbi:MAG: glucose-6-phosphate dehydrogenase, partial [Candidatus Binataceae bacterium]